MWQLSESDKTTLTFLKEMTDKALEEARSGNPSLANALSKKNSAFSYYFINVATRGVVTPEQFATQYPQLLKEAELLRQEYNRSLKADANDERLDKLESKLEEGLAAFKTELLNEVKALIESVKPAEVETEKTTKKNKAKEQPAETETQPENQEDTPSEEA